MSSTEYIQLMQALHQQKKKIEQINVNFGKTEIVHITYDDSSEANLTEMDAIDYALNLKRGIDNDGDYVFRQIKDLNKYFDEERFLFSDHDQKAADASHAVADRSFTFSYNVDDLQNEFLESKRKNDKNSCH